VIPPSVTKIGVYAFHGCNIDELSHPLLTIENGCAIKENVVLYCTSQSDSIKIPDGVTEIGNCAFMGCESLESVVIPSSVTKIDSCAFYGCKSVTLGDDFEEVPSEWFDSLNKADVNYEIVCTEGSRTYKAVKRNPELRMHLNSMEIAKEKKIAEINKACETAVLSSLLKGVSDSSFDILSNTNSSTTVLVKIGKNAGVFKLGEDSSNCLPKIKKVIEAFSDSSKNGADIFAEITEQGLPLAEISEKKAENMTLKADSCGSLNLFVAGELRAMNYDGVKTIALFGITKIGVWAFMECESLESVVIPSSVTEIGGRAFAERKSLESVVIPSSVTKIGESAFYECKSLSSVVIPSSVKKIGDYAFMGCESLESVVIPSSVTEIGTQAFSSCSSLESVEIPPSVKKIGVNAFAYCTSLASVAFSGTVAQWKTVEKDIGWNDGVPTKCVKCADGEAEC
jgi:hypothetical protein